MYSTCVKSHTFTLVAVLQNTALADWPVRLPSDSFIACLECFQIARILAAHVCFQIARIVALYILRNGDTRASVIRKGPYIPIDPLFLHILMRDERRKEERSKQGQTNKAKQHSTPNAVTFPKKNELPQVGFEPTTLYTLDRAFYTMYMYVLQKSSVWKRK